VAQQQQRRHQRAPRLGARSCARSLSPSHIAESAAPNAHAPRAPAKAKRPTLFDHARLVGQVQTQTLTLQRIDRRLLITRLPKRTHGVERRTLVADVDVADILSVATRERRFIATEVAMNAAERSAPTAPLSMAPPMTACGICSWRLTIGPGPNPSRPTSIFHMAT
jgi:hypothetical protein